MKNLFWIIRLVFCFVTGFSFAHKKYGIMTAAIIIVLSFVVIEILWNKRH